MALKFEVAMYLGHSVLYALDGWISGVLLVADEIASILRTGDFSSIAICYY